MNRIGALAIAITALLVAAAPASAAKTQFYKGKTNGGYSLSFKKKGNSISKIETYVPTTCVSTTGSPRVTGEEFAPPGSFRLGKTTKRSATKYQAWRGDVRKNYQVSIKKKGRLWKAKLHVNFSYSQVVPDGSGSMTLKAYVCRGDDYFTF